MISPETSPPPSTESPGPIPEGPAAKSLRETLYEGLRLELQAEDGTLGFWVHRPQEDSQGVEADVALRGGGVELSLHEDDLFLDELRFELAEIDIAASEHPPHGLQISDLRATVSARTPFDCVWSEEGDRVEFEGNVDARIEWTLRTKDSVLPIRPVIIENLPVRGRLGRDIFGDFVMELAGDWQGRFFEIDGVVEISDLRFDLIMAEILEDPEQPASPSEKQAKN